jgi:hypothetical protein
MVRWGTGFDGLLGLRHVALPVAAPSAVNRLLWEAALRRKG